MYLFTVDVTQECIDKGKSGSVTECAIALALKKIWPDAVVTYEGLYLCGRQAGIGDVVKLPSEAINFIYSFDKAKVKHYIFKLYAELMTDRPAVEVKPFSFTVQLPEWAIEAINIEEITSLLQDGETSELQKA